MQIIVDVDNDYVPEEGDHFDDVTAALNFAQIPANVQTSSNVNAHEAIGLVRELARLDYAKLGSGTRSALDKLQRKAALLVKD